jgi:hypothetical protein
MFDRIRFRQPDITRQSSAAKGFMGACPQVNMMDPD